MAPKNDVMTAKVIEQAFDTFVNLTTKKPVTIPSEKKDTIKSSIKEQLDRALEKHIKALNTKASKMPAGEIEKIEAELLALHKLNKKIKLIKSALKIA